MHMVMGLGNNQINDLKRNVIELDNIETGMDYSYQKEIQNDLIDLYKDLEAAKDIHANLNLAKMVVIND